LLWHLVSLTFDRDRDKIKIFYYQLRGAISRVACFQESLEKSGKKKRIREKSGINQKVQEWSGNLFDEGKLPLQVT
jgi:hypothetical protein